jgi:hypothetical protein
MQLRLDAPQVSYDVDGGVESRRRQALGVQASRDVWLHGISIPYDADVSSGSMRQVGVL